MVAKSFQQFPILSEPYNKNNKLYVKVKNPKNGNIREVRYYSEEEYTRLYPEPVVDKNKIKDFPIREDIEFADSYIWIFDTTDEAIPWFLSSGAKYSTLYGWHFLADEEVPPVPEGVRAVKLFGNLCYLKGKRWDNDAIRTIMKCKLRERY